MQTRDLFGLNIEGHIKIFDPTTSEVFVEKRNAIHFENFSVALADSIANTGKGFVYEMVFGNGGTTVDPTGIITYLTPNTVGTNAGLYNETFAKIVDDRAVANPDPIRNRIETRHVVGTNYTDVFITCLLDYGEPVGQEAFDNSPNNASDFVFDELGLRSYNLNIPGKLLTHVMFHPVQKALNRLIQVEYTVRIQSLTGLSEIV
jgi:hypothetical protein